MEKKNNKMKKEGIRYIFFGGCTTLVNLVGYFVLRSLFGMDITKANFLAIFFAILFAYVVNKKFVFESKVRGFRGIVKEMAQFVGMRLLTMFIEVFGVVLLCCIWGVWDMAAKLALQFVVLVLNFVFSKMFVFKEKSHTNGQLSAEKRRDRICIALGFLIPAITMLVAYIANGVYPFGDHGVLIIDSLHQYLPFFTDFHEKLAENASLMYSFGGGFGYNLWATYAYYLASPLNLLITLVSMEHVMDFMAYIILLKIALSGAAFAWYLSGKGSKEHYLPVPFACMYALSTFMIGYYFNLMWLDSIMIVPILMYGIEQIVDDKKGSLYGLVLFYGLFCNYYIGFMLCLFSCLYFGTLWLAKKRGTLKGFFKSSLKFAWFSLLAGGMGALVLLPAYFNLKITESADSSFPTKVKFYVNELQQLTGHLALVEPINIYDDQSGVNIYCGVIVLILIFLYLFDRKIRIAERVYKTALLLILALSMNFNMLNYIWHGFHVQNGLPNRFAFLYIALLLSMGFDALQHVEHQGNLVMTIAWVVPIIFVAYAMVTECGEHEWYVYIVSLLLLVLYGVLLLIYISTERRQKLIQLILTGVMTLEMVVTGVYGVCMNGTVSRSSYVNDQIIYQKMMDRTDTGDEFFRSEIDSQRMRNENMFMGANGIVLFSSTMPEATVNLCKSIGMEARTNKNGYLGVTKLFNDVFGIRYVLSKMDSDTLYGMDHIDYEEPLHLYENKNALSLGFVVSKDLKNWDIDLGEPMDVQRMFATLATGVPFSYTLRESYSLEEGPVYIIRLHPGEQTYIQVTENVKSLKIKTPHGEKTYNNYTENLFDLGRVKEEGEESKTNISLTLKEGHSSPVPVRVYTCTDEEYQAVHDKLSEHQMTEVQEKGNKVEGLVTAGEDGMLFLTIPYDEGWKISVDGEVVEAYRVGEAFTGIDLEKGEHHITMEFTPRGFWEGTGISLICMILYMISGMLEGQKKKKKEKL